MLTTDPNLARIPGVTHGFFGREGGVSEGLYASLNCGYGAADDPARVTENRARVLRALDLPSLPLVTLYQVHSARAVTLTAPFERTAAPEADAMVTTVPGLALGVLAADCAPVLLADPQAGVIGAAHAGWKGALAGVLEATVQAMQAAGAVPSRLVAAIGPCISQPNYEVGEEFRARVLANDPEGAECFAAGVRPDKARFDLPRYCVLRLTRAGVTRIAPPRLCTYAASDRYFSFRRTTHRGEPDYGRNISVIALRPGAAR